MFSFMIVRYLNPNEANRVRDFFLTFDDDFYPPLSQRNGELEKVYIGRALLEGRVGIVEVDNKIIAASTYWYEGDVLRMCVTGVDREYRKSSALFKLLRFIIESESQKGLQKIFAKTWSTNDSMKNILNRLGFQRVNVIEGDITKSRVTETFEIDFDQIRDYLKRY